MQIFSGHLIGIVFEFLVMEEQSKLRDVVKVTVCPTRILEVHEMMDSGGVGKLS